MTGAELQPHLVGELIELRPLREDDWEILFAVASDPLIWEQHPAYDRYREDVFRGFFREAMASEGALVAIDRKTRQVIGSSRYVVKKDPDSGQPEIEIGWTFLARSHWGGKYNGEMKRLMVEHALRYADSVVFLVGLTNFRSRRALEKIGAVLTSRREQASLQGRMIEHVVYKITKGA